MTDHQAKTAALMAYAAGRLSTPGRARIEAHLQGCDRCRRELAAIGTYDRVAAEAREAPLQALEWSRFEVAMAREHAQRPTGRRRRALAAAIGVVLAAAAAAALVWSARRGPSRAAGSAPVATATPRAAPRPAGATTTAEPMNAVITAVAGRVERLRAGSPPAPLEPGDSVSQNDAVAVGPQSQAHLRFHAETGFLVGPGSRVALARASSAAVQLDIDHGTVSNVVAHGQPPTRYEVHANPYIVRVTGTRFAVRRDEQGVAVRVARGTVEVLEGERVVRVIHAPGSWASAKALNAPEVHDPLALSPEAASWPVLRVPPTARLAAWELDGTTFSAGGGLAMQVPAGDLHLVAVERSGKRVPVGLTIQAEGLDLTEANLAGLLPEPVGYLPPQVISESLQKARAALQSCYERTLRRGPDLGGVYDLQVKVGRSGVVQRAQLSATDGEPPPPAALTSCIAQILSRRPFPKPRGGPVTFQVPLKFRTVRP